MAKRLSSLLLILLLMFVAVGCGAEAEDDEWSDADIAAYEADREEERGELTEPYKEVITDYSEYRIFSVVLHGKQCYILEGEDDKFICDWSSEGVTDTDTTTE